MKSAEEWCLDWIGATHDEPVEARAYLKLLFAKAQHDTLMEAVKVARDRDWNDVGDYGTGVSNACNDIATALETLAKELETDNAEI